MARRTQKPKRTDEVVDNGIRGPGEWGTSKKDLVESISRKVAQGMGLTVAPVGFAPDKGELVDETRLVFGELVCTKKVKPGKTVRIDKNAKLEFFGVDAADGTIEFCIFSSSDSSGPNSANSGDVVHTELSSVKMTLKEGVLNLEIYRKTAEVITPKEGEAIIRSFEPGSNTTN